MGDLILGADFRRVALRNLKTPAPTEDEARAARGDLAMLEATIAWASARRTIVEHTGLPLQAETRRRLMAMHAIAKEQPSQ